MKNKEQNLESWEEEFDQEFCAIFNLTERTIERIKDFIKKTRQEAYEQGKKDGIIINNEEINKIIKDIKENITINKVDGKFIERYLNVKLRKIFIKKYKK